MAEPLIGVPLDGILYWLPGSRPLLRPALIGAEIPYGPPRYAPVRCACCTSCFHDHLAGRCVYGGPFTGYTNALPTHELNGKIATKQITGETDDDVT